MDFIELSDLHQIQFFAHLIHIYSDISTPSFDRGWRPFVAKILLDWALLFYTSTQLISFVPRRWLCYSVWWRALNLASWNRTGMPSMVAELTLPCLHSILVVRFPDFTWPWQSSSKLQITLCQDTINLTNRWLKHWDYGHKIDSCFFARFRLKFTKSFICHISWLFPTLFDNPLCPIVSRSE